MVSRFTVKSVQIFLWSCICISTLVTKNYAQTPGSIFAPASAPGDAVLDPNSDGFISQSTVGFVSNDVAESELPFVPMAFLQMEISADMLTGPSCGFTDFIDNGSETPAMVYYDNKIYCFASGWVMPCQMPRVIVC